MRPRLGAGAVGVPSLWGAAARYWLGEPLAAVPYFSTLTAALEAANMTEVVGPGFNGTLIAPQDPVSGRGPAAGIQGLRGRRRAARRGAAQSGDGRALLRPPAPSLSVLTTPLYSPRGKGGNVEGRGRGGVV